MKTATDWINLFRQQAKTIPEDVTWEGAVHTLADLLESTPLTPEAQATLTGIGAMIYRQGLREMQAGIGTASLMQRLHRP